MSVKLKWITPNAEEMISNIARVSNPANRDNTETASRLIKFLIKSEHWSPFEMANMCVEIETDRATSAQILRHRSFTFQEYSQRYAKVPKPDIPNLRRQDIKNRQSSHDDLPSDVIEKYSTEINKLFEKTYEIDDAMLSDGIAKETARAIMPMCSKTCIIMNGTIRSWLHYIRIRGAEDTQLEHRTVALAVAKILEQELPNVYEAFVSCTKI